MVGIKLTMAERVGSLRYWARSFDASIWAKDRQRSTKPSSFLDVIPRQWWELWDGVDRPEPLVRCYLPSILATAWPAPNDDAIHLPTEFRSVQEFHTRESAPSHRFLLSIVTNPNELPSSEIQFISKSVNIFVLCPIQMFSFFLSLSLVNLIKLIWIQFYL